MPRIQVVTGLPAVKAQSNSDLIGGTFAEMLTSELMPQYYQLLKAGLLYSGSVIGANPVSFLGAAAGTPLLGLYNPVNSGKDLTLLEVVLGIRTTGTVAANEDFNHWGGNQGGAVVSGVGVSRNLYSLAATGSIATFIANAVNTGALASALLRPSVSLGAVPAAAPLNVGLLRDEIKGEIIIAPGSYYAFGAAAALTGAVIDASVIWAETPV
jgi:hypothetical protein